MKNTFTVVITIFALLVLAACSAAASAGSSGAEVTEAGALASAGPLTMDYEGALPVELQLAIGTLMLDGTDHAVNSETAVQLLPLWKAINSLSDSSSVAPEEVRAIYTQIQETMTSEQIQAIADMQLTRQDMTAAAEDLGIEFGFGGRFGELTPEMQATMQAARESGQFPQGGFGGGFEGGPPGEGGGPGAGGGPGGGFGGGELNPEQQATAIARREAGGAGGALVPSTVVNAVIEYLDSLVN